jgi:enoyl-CoA hydratase/carnithine racemase
MPEELLLKEKKERVCTITFNRPEKRNALTPLMLFQMADLLKSIREEGEVRCLVLRGAGDKAFSSGYDISEIPKDMTPEMAAAFKAQNPLATGMNAVLDFPYPVIAMINGHAFGAGCDLTMACDIRIASENAQMGIPPARLGIIYQPSGIIRVINTVGMANAKEIFFTGRSYGAGKAKEMGLVHYVLPPDQLLPFTYEMAQEIAGNAPLSLKGMKTVFHKISASQELSPQDAEEIEALRVQAFNSEDLKEGQRAFKEKRKPVFQGK